MSPFYDYWGISGFKPRDVAVTGRVATNLATHLLLNLRARGYQIRKVWGDKRRISVSREDCVPLCTNAAALAKVFVVQYRIVNSLCPTISTTCTSNQPFYEDWIVPRLKWQPFLSLCLRGLRVMTDREGWVNSALSLRGGVHIGAKSVLHINLIWFGYIARLSQRGGGGYFTLSNDFYLPLLRLEVGGGGSAPCGESASALDI
jgi:hypothetical protein